MHCTPEVEDGRAQAVDAQGRVAVDRRHHPGRLGAGDEARGGHRVAADVEHAAAAPAQHVPDVGRIGQQVAEMAVDRLELADPPAADELARRQPLRVRAHHEGFLDVDAGTVARRQQRPRVGQVHAERLLAQHVLAGLGGLDRPGHVEMVGQGVVDRVDLGVGQERLVAVVAARDAQAVRHLAAAGRLARGQGHDLAARRPLQRWNDLLARDLGRAEHPEPQLAHLASPAFRCRRCHPLHAPAVGARQAAGTHGRQDSRPAPAIPC